MLSMNTTIEFLELKALAAVVTCGTFTAAAEALGTDKAHVSRIVTRLESKLGARLFERSTRRLSITEIGREVYERAYGILQALEETENSVAQSKGKPSGTLKLTAGPEFGTLVVNSWIASYLRKYLDVRVEAEFSNRLADIIHEGIDVAVRVGTLSDSELSARKLGEIEYRFYASPDYLRDRGTVADLDDLEDHDFVAFTPRGAPKWTVFRGLEKRTVSPTPKYQVDNNQAALGMTIEGIGVCLLPSFMAASGVRNGTLEIVLPDWQPTSVPVHAVFPSTRYLAPKVRAFVDLAKEQFRVA